MVNVRIENKPSFKVIGQKTWISGQDNEIFGSFWEESEKNGLVDRLKAISEKVGDKVTNSGILGVSCVENDPENRAFDFFIAAETTEVTVPDDLECHVVPACCWAIFSNNGDLPMSLIEAEMYAFMEWLPTSPYHHANAPELEVYPENEIGSVEFWLPVISK